MSEEYILKVTERLYFKNKDGMQSKSFFTLHTHIYLGNIPLSWIDDRDFLDRLKELVRLRDSRDYIDIIPIAELTEEMQVKVRNNYEINSKDHNNAQYRVNAYIDRRLRQTQPSTVDATAEQTDPAASMEKELDSIAGIGAIGRRRMLMMDKYGLTISQIWEYENPGSEWRFLDAGLKNAYRHKIEQAINRARDKVKTKKATRKRQSKK